LRRVPVLGWLWGCYWAPYRWAMPHRDRWSHAPGLGTLGRMLWLAPLWFGMWWWFGVGFGWVALGLAVADVVHSGLDAFWRMK